MPVNDVKLSKIKVALFADTLASFCVFVCLFALYVFCLCFWLLLFDALKCLGFSSCMENTVRRSISECLVMYT